MLKGSPRPRKDSAVSDRIAIATINTVLAMMTGITLGRTWRVTRYQLLAPSAAARSTYARFLMESVWARTRRAVLGHVVSPITRTMTKSDCPKIDASEIAKTSHGMTKPQSVIRIKSWSTHPPRYPATSPMADPITMVIAVADRPTSSDTLAPWIVRVRTDRP